MAARSISERERSRLWPAAALLALLALPAVGKPLTNAWSAVRLPTHGGTQIYGGYAAGCIAGAARLPLDGEGYQVVRVSRNRYWGHPAMVNFVQQLGVKVSRAGLPPLYVGDMGQPRGGPMSYGHASHQIGLDVDIWASLLPKPPLAASQREDVPLPELVNASQTAIDAKNWDPRYVDVLRMAAEAKEVERIFVHWQIKKRLCDTVKGDRRWLSKIRAWYGHTEHFHVRLACPADSPNCVHQAPLPANDGCGEELHWWLTVVQAQVSGRPQAEQTESPRPKLPEQCNRVLTSP
jgi:penicillin-insensitive murein endopeptidase